MPSMNKTDRGPNPFTCTLGHALEWKGRAAKHPSSFETVLNLVDEQARDLPNSPCLGFADLSPQDGVDGSLVTFSELRDLSIQAAAALKDTLPAPALGKANPTIGLLANSSINFISTWLGLMRLGCRVFFLA